MSKKRIIVTQVGSANRRTKDKLETLKSLGLGRIGRSREHVATPSVIGMIRSVSNLVTVKEV
jgi:large subunit ribosomal protein L30